MRLILEIVITDPEVAENYRDLITAYPERTMGRFQQMLDEAHPYGRMGTLSVRNVRMESVTPETDRIGPLG